MSTIHIQWLSDEKNCELCGPSWSRGARVSIDGIPILNLEPVASCTDPLDYSEEQVYSETLKALGHTITEQYVDD